MSSLAGTSLSLDAELTQSEIDCYLAFDVFSEDLFTPQSFVGVRVREKGSLESENRSLDDESIAEDEVDNVLASLLDIRVAPLTSRLSLPASSSDKCRREEHTTERQPSDDVELTEQEVNKLLTSEVFDIPVNPLPFHPSLLEASPRSRTSSEEQIDTFLTSYLFDMAIEPLATGLSPVSANAQASARKRKRSGGQTRLTSPPELGDNHREQEQEQYQPTESEEDNAEVPHAVWTPAGKRLFGLRRRKVD